MNTATFTANHIRNAKLPNKPRAVSYVVVAFKNGQFYEPVQATCYKSASKDASKVYACVCAHHNEFSLSGSGKATGYGYHKESAAIDSAIKSAGIKLDTPIDGTGDSAIREALIAIAVALGFDESELHVVTA